MKQVTSKSLYDAHSWAGLIVGLALYVVSFTGVFSLFQTELWRWDVPLPSQELAIDSHYKINGPVQEIVTRYPQAQELSIEMPHYYYPAIKVIAIPDGVWINSNFDPVSGEFINQSGRGLSRFLRNIHSDLWLPSPWGRYLVGLLGVFMVFSITVGLFIHGHLIRDFFRYRPHRSYRLWLSDGHKGLGLWGIFFNYLVGYTGAFIGLAGLLSLIMAYTVFQGDERKVRDVILGEQLRSAKIEAQMMDLDILADRARAYWGGAKIVKTYIRYPHDKNGFITFTVDTPETDAAIAGKRSVTYSVISGEFLKSRDPLSSGLGVRIDAMIVPLHYANYSGVTLKFIYGLLGIGTSLMIISGLLLWVDRRTIIKAKRHKHYRFLCSLTVGICIGLPLATVVSFYAARLSWLFTHDSRTWWIGLGYFGGCSLAIIYAWFRADHYRASRELLSVTGGLCLIAPLMNYLTSGNHVFLYLVQGNVPAATVDVLLFSFGLLFLYIANIILAKRWKNLLNK